MVSCNGDICSGAVGLSEATIEFCRLPYFRDHSVYSLRQWDTTLQCNVGSHWLNTYTEWSLYFLVLMLVIVALCTSYHWYDLKREICFTAWVYTLICVCITTQGYERSVSNDIITGTTINSLRPGNALQKRKQGHYWWRQRLVACGLFSFNSLRPGGAHIIRNPMRKIPVASCS